MARSIWGVSGITKQEMPNLWLKGEERWLFQAGEQHEAILGSGVPGWMGQGVDVDEVGERVAKAQSLRWPCVPTGDCPGALAPSFEPTLDAAAPI